MSISRKPKAASSAPDKADAFIAGAPDASTVATSIASNASTASSYEKGIAKGHKRQISHTIAPDLLRRIDQTAARSGQGRAAIINLAIFRFLESDSLTS
jgi:hypothetical protein